MSLYTLKIGTDLLGIQRVPPQWHQHLLYTTALHTGDQSYAESYAEEIMPDEDRQNSCKKHETQLLSVALPNFSHTTKTYFLQNGMLNILISF